MKKIIFTFLLILTQAQCAKCIPCSHTHQRDDFGTTYDNFYQHIRDRNKDIQALYEKMKNEEIENILTELDNKNILLNNIQNLSYTDDMSKHEELFLIDTKKKLKAILIDMWGEE